MLSLHVIETDALFAQNCVFMHPDDVNPLHSYVRIEDNVYFAVPFPRLEESTLPFDHIPAGSIGLNLLQRKRHGDTFVNLTYETCIREPRQKLSRDALRSYAIRKLLEQYEHINTPLTSAPVSRPMHVPTKRFNVDTFNKITISNVH
jgi:hypothetical protein